MKLSHVILLSTVLICVPVHRALCQGKDRANRPSRGAGAKGQAERKAAEATEDVKAKAQSRNGAQDRRPARAGQSRGEPEKAGKPNEEGAAKPSRGKPGEKGPKNTVDEKETIGKDNAKGKGGGQQATALKKQLVHEEAKHLKRAARLERMLEVATKLGKVETIQRITKLMEREQQRYERKQKKMLGRQREAGQGQVDSKKVRDQSAKPVRDSKPKTEDKTETESDKKD